MTNAVEIRKQLSSLNFINVKLKSKQILNGNFLSVQFTENANCMSVVVLQYTVVFNAGLPREFRGSGQKRTMRPPASESSKKFSWSRH